MEKSNTKKGKIVIEEGSVAIFFDKNKQLCDISGFTDEDRSLLLNEWRGRPFELCDELFNIVKLCQTDGEN